MEKTSFNFFRKIWHLLGLVIPAVLYLDAFTGYGDYRYATRVVIVIFLVFSLVLLAILEVLRFRSEGFSQFFWRWFGPLMKEGERGQMNATIPYFTANLIVVWCFPAEVAVLSLAFLVLGDPSAAYFGSRYGKHRLYNGKSWEGILAFLLASLFTGMILSFLFSLSGSDSVFSLITDVGWNWGAVVILLIGVVTAAVTEFFSATTWKGFLDDNLLIPVFASLAMSGAAVLLLGESFSSMFLTPWNLFLKI